MTGDGHHERRAGRVASIAAVAVLAGVTTWLSIARRTAPSPSPSSAEAVWDDDPVVRAAACAAAATVDVLARTADQDWRVRAAAFAALDRRAALAIMPMRDVPMAERERALLDWIDANAPAMRGRLCEVFAHGGTVEFGDALVAVCLQCHAGATPAPKHGAKRCLPCHDRIHETWRGTAHAQSLTHLRLPTVDAVTRQPATYDFGGRVGISCVGCHRPAGEHDSCVATFATESCATCHADTDGEWAAWRSGAQPRRDFWPPGAIEMARGDTRECVDCHMPEASHHWGARRDVAMLRSGVDLSIRPRDDGVAIVLANLSGHAYPTGSTRRALEIIASVNGAQEQSVATLAPARVEGRLSPPAPALAPGETRRFSLGADVRSVRVRLVYRRDRFDPESDRVEVASAARVFPEAR